MAGPIAELGVREELLHRLGHQVGGRVAHARQLVGPRVLQIDRDVHAGDVVVCVCISVSPLSCMACQSLAPTARRA